VIHEVSRHKVPAHQVLVHAHPAGFPVGTVLLVAGALILGIVAGLLLRLVRRGGRRDQAQPAAAAAPSAQAVPALSYSPEPVMPRHQAAVHPVPGPARDAPDPARPSTEPGTEPGTDRSTEPGTERGTERITVSLADRQAERDALVQACIRARDLSGGGAVRRILGEALALAGVIEVDPTGQPFDPDVHCSVGVLHTPVPRLDDTIASAERVGYDDHGRQLRPPEVIVFTSEERP